VATKTQTTQDSPEISRNHSAVKDCVTEQDVLEKLAKIDERAQAGGKSPRNVRLSLTSQYRALEKEAAGIYSAPEDQEKRKALLLEIAVHKAASFHTAGERALAKGAVGEAQLSFSESLKASSFVERQPVPSHAEHALRVGRAQIFQRLAAANLSDSKLNALIGQPQTAEPKTLIASVERVEKSVNADFARAARELSVLSSKQDTNGKAEIAKLQSQLDRSHEHTVATLYKDVLAAETKKRDQQVTVSGMMTERSRSHSIELRKSLDSQGIVDRTIGSLFGTNESVTKLAEGAESQTKLLAGVNARLKDQTEKLHGYLKSGSLANLKKGMSILASGNEIDKSRNTIVAGIGSQMEVAGRLVGQSQNLETASIVANGIAVTAGSVGVGIVTVCAFPLIVGAGAGAITAGGMAVVGGTIYGTAMGAFRRKLETDYQVESGRLSKEEGAVQLSSGIKSDIFNSATTSVGTLVGIGAAAKIFSGMGTAGTTISGRALGGSLSGGVSAAARETMNTTLSGPETSGGELTRNYASSVLTGMVGGAVGGTSGALQAATTKRLAKEGISLVEGALTTLFGFGTAYARYGSDSLTVDNVTREVTGALLGGVQGRATNTALAKLQAVKPLLREPADGNDGLPQKRYENPQVEQTSPLVAQPNPGKQDAAPAKLNGLPIVSVSRTNPGRLSALGVHWEGPKPEGLRLAAEQRGSQSVQLTDDPSHRVTISGVGAGHRVLEKIRSGLVEYGKIGSYNENRLGLVGSVVIVEDLGSFVNESGKKQSPIRMLTSEDGAILYLRKSVTEKPAELKKVLTEFVDRNNNLDMQLPQSRERTVMVRKRLENHEDFEQPDERAQHGSWKGRPIIGRDVEVHGKVYLSGGRSRPAVVIDDSIDPLLEASYNEFRGTLGSNPSVADITKSIEKFVSVKMPYWSSEDHNGVSVDNQVIKNIRDAGGEAGPDSVIKFSHYLTVHNGVANQKGGGVCAHQGVFAAYLMEKLRDQGLLPGSTQISFDRNSALEGAHAWARLTEPNGAVHIVDPAQNYVGPIQNASNWSYMRTTDIERHRVAPY